MAESLYRVWRRSDGYVGFSKGTGQPNNGSRDTFEVLLTTADWGEAYAMIAQERDEKHFALVASWKAESKEAMQP